jgi:molybdopterin molybdotransferase
MLSVTEARSRIVNATAPLAGTERVPLARALGRVVAEPVLADCQVPPADNSSMDGFALRYDDLAPSGWTLPVTARVAAGHAPGPLAAGGAVRIFTGAVVPAGADTVVKVEDCEVVADVVHVRDRHVRRGDNVRRAGEDVARGATVLPAGLKIRPQDLGVAASVGTTSVSVRRAPRVAVLVTGDELVEPGRPLGPGQIYDSNGTMIAGLLASLGCEPVVTGRVGDTLDATREALRAAALDADLVVTSGGVSVGEEDHVKTAVRSLGELNLWKVSVKPGKPIGFGRVGGVPWLGLPGNPVSGFVTFLLFGAPLVRALQGRASLMPEGVPLPAGFIRDRGPRREEYVRVRVENGRAVAHPRQGAGVLSSASWGDGLVRIPTGTAVREGDELLYFAYSTLLA